MRSYNRKRDEAREYQKHVSDESNWNWMTKPVTYTAVVTMENTYLGTATRGGIKTWTLIDAEYSDTAIFPMTERLKRTVKKFPKPPAGRSIASKRPPTFPPVYPASQAGTEGATTANAAPTHCKVT